MTASRGPRIAPVDRPTPEQAEILGKTPQRPDGGPLNLFSTLAHHPRLLNRVMALGGAFMTHPTIPTRDREIVILRVAARTRSRYEFAQHAQISAHDRVTAEQLDAIATGDDAVRWDSGDGLLLRFADDLLDRDAVGDATWREMSARFDEPQLVELLFLVGYYRAIAGFVRSVRVETEPELPLPEVAIGVGWQ